MLNSFQHLICLFLEKFITAVNKHLESGLVLANGNKLSIFDHLQKSSTTILC